MALVLWWRLIRFEYALIVTTATAAVTLAYSSPEPYSAMITVLLPPVLILTWSGLRARERDACVARSRPNVKLAARSAGGWAAVIGAGIFLGVAATCYTLLLAYSAFTVLLMAVTLAASRRRDGLKAALDPLLRLAVIGVIAAAIASTTWLPFLLRAAHDPVSNTGSAYHYLPADGAELTFPMLKFTLLGALCLLGTLWLVVRARSSVRAGGLAIGVLAVYLWSLLSMLATLARTTLLSFRLQPTLTVLLTAAGVFGFIEVTQSFSRAWRATTPGAGPCCRWRRRSAWPRRSPSARTSPTCCDPTSPSPTPTPTATANAATAVRRARRSSTPRSTPRSPGRPASRATRRWCMTADYSFLSYYPYFGFQGLTSHYANPLAQFDKRAAAIKSWSKLKAADPFIHALDTLPWAPPTVFLMRHGGSAGATSGKHLHPAAGRRRLPQPAQRAPLHRGTQRRDVRRPAVHRHHHRPVRVGRPQTLMATEAADTGQLASSSVSAPSTMQSER